MVHSVVALPVRTAGLYQYQVNRVDGARRRSGPQAQIEAVLGRVHLLRAATEVKPRPQLIKRKAIKNAVCTTRPEKALNLRIAAFDRRR